MNNKRPCSKCGSTIWPSPTSWCELCRDDEDEDDLSAIYEKTEMERLTDDADMRE